MTDHLESAQAHGGCRGPHLIRLFRRNLEDLAQTPPQPFVVSPAKLLCRLWFHHSCDVIGSGAMNQKQPCRLQQRLVFSRQHLQMRSDEIGVPQRGPENLDATPMRKQLVRSPPHNGCFVCDYCCHLQLVASMRFLANSTLGFSPGALEFQPRHKTASRNE